MQTKLTLRLDARLIRRAKSYARRSGKSVSTIVGDLFALLGSPEVDAESELTPTVRRLVGALGDTPTDENDYRRHLDAKHR